MAIRRPPTTFSDTISTADIADDAITTAKVADDQITGALLANDIAISTTGNIATTGSGTLTVAGNTTLSGTNNLGSNPTITLGSNATLGNSVAFPTKVKMGNYQFDQGIATGSISITGVGFKPNLIEAWINYTGSTVAILRSYGYCRDVGGTLTQQCTQFTSDTSNSTLANHVASTSDATSGVDGAFQKFAITSFDTDGFTMANTKTGTPTTVHGLTYIVYFIGTMS